MGVLVSVMAVVAVAVIAGFIGTLVVEIKELFSDFDEEE